jgi:hypothetical protein
MTKAIVTTFTERAAMHGEEFIEEISGGSPIYAGTHHSRKIIRDAAD